MASSRRSSSSDADRESSATASRSRPSSPSATTTMRGGSGFPVRGCPRRRTPHARSPARVARSPAAATAVRRTAAGHPMPRRAPRLELCGHDPGVDYSNRYHRYASTRVSNWQTCSAGQPIHSLGNGRMSSDPKVPSALSPRQQAARPDRRRSPGSAVGDGCRMRCTGATPDVDGLVAQLDRARADSTLAGRSGDRCSPTDRRRAEHRGRGERSAHVKALSDDKITRMIRPDPATSTSQSTSADPTSTGTSAKPPPPTQSGRVRHRPQAVRDRRRAAAAQQSGYRAGLIELDRRVVHRGGHSSALLDQGQAVVTSPEPRPPPP